MKNKIIENKIEEFDYFNLLVRDEIFEIIETKDKEHPVEIYNPTIEQRKIIIKMILDNINIKEDKISTKISSFDTIFKLIPMLTNVPLKFDENNPNDVEKVKKISEDPSDLFLDINTKINKIINKQLYRYYDNLKQLLEMPEDLRDGYIENIDKIEKENVALEDNKLIELSEKDKRRLELEAELKKLDEEGI